MSRAAYAQAYTASGDRAEAFCRVISALTRDDHVELVAERWAVRESKRQSVSLAKLPNLVNTLYTTQTRLTAHTWTRLPSGQPLNVSIQITDDEYTVLSSEKEGPLVLIASGNPFLSGEARVPRYGPWPAGATAALAERKTRADVAWIVQMLQQALHDPLNAPIAFAWETSSWPLAYDSFAVHRQRPGWFVCDYAIAWLEANTEHRVNSLVRLGKDELHALVTNERISPNSKLRTGGMLAALADPREQILGLLDCDDSRVEAAIDALAVQDIAMLDMESVADEAVTLLENAIDFDDNTRDAWKERCARWPSVPLWRVIKSALGVTVVTVPEWKMERTIGDFYSTLRGLLLDE